MQAEIALRLDADGTADARSTGTIEAGNDAGTGIWKEQSVKFEERAKTFGYR
jgi:hypothetical protein